MDPKIEVTSTKEAPEIEVTSAAEGPEVGGTSAAEGPEVGGTSAAEGPEVGGTSAAEGPEVGGTSAAEGPEVGGTSAAEGPEVGGTSAAEAPEIEVVSAAEGPEVGGTSAAEAPKIDVTSAAKGSVVGKTSSAEGPVVRKYWMYDSTSSSDSIFGARAHIRYGRESDFVPKLVSIGPFHSRRQHLLPMDKAKVWCMSGLLMMRLGDANKGEDRFLFYNRGGSNLDRIPVDPFMKFERRARSFYKEKFDRLSDVQFVQMLLLDSCFVIRVILSLYGAIPESMGCLQVNIKEARSDLLLLENQIPLFFLNVVYYWLFPKVHEYMKLEYVLTWFVERDLPWEHNSNSLHFESDHLLDFYWKMSVPKTELLMNCHKLPQKSSLQHIPRSMQKLIANATELHQMAGIKFENDNNYQGLKVEFSNGIMRMHCLKIDSTLETLLVNLIAFENSMPSSLRIISTYIKYLDDLIDSEKDVELLQKFGVIFNTLSTHTKAATFFNDIGNLCLIEDWDNPFYHLFNDVKKYYNSSWNRRWASLQNNYFNSPWAGISVFAGVTLLILTVLQTFYTIYGYYYPRN